MSAPSMNDLKDKKSPVIGAPAAPGGASDPAVPPPFLASGRSAGDWFVVLAMTLVTAAVGIGLYAHMGLTLWLAVVAALSLYVCLLSMHALMRQTERLHGLQAELARLEAELDRAPAPRVGSANPFGDHLGEAARAAPQQAAPQMKPRPAPVATAAARPAPPSLTPPPQPAPSRAPAPPPLTPPAASLAAPSLPAPASAPLPPAAAAMAPPQPAQPQHVPALPAQPTPAADAAEPARASSIRDRDVEMIHGLIKKLADEISAGETQAPGRGALDSGTTEAAIDTSVSALRSTAAGMRSARPEPPTAPEREPLPQQTLAQQNQPQRPPQANPARDALPVWPSTPVAPASRPLIAAVGEAIAAQRADVLLEPILGLGDQRAHHYEVHIRLKAADGRPLDTDSLMGDLHDTGLLPLLDCTRVSRMASVARRLSDRGNTSSLFSQFSGQSLRNDKFLIEFADAYHERDGFAGQLVLTFSQSDVRRLGKRDWSTLDDMRDLGFRFALDAVTDLDMDFSELREHGFAFAKLDADVFLEGLHAPDGFVPASDICRHLSEHGLTLIVGEIDDEAKLARIFGFGVLFGQGQLFGAPRVMKPEGTSTRTTQKGASGSHAAA